MIEFNCIFCKIIAREISSNIIAENNDLIVIKDINPKAPVHYLIIPKKHIQDIQSLEKEDVALAGNILLMAQKLSLHLPDPQAFRLVTNNGAQAGQVIFHLHIHFLSGKQLPQF